MCKVISQAVMTLDSGSGSAPSSPRLPPSESAHSIADSVSSSPPGSPGAAINMPASPSRHSLAIKWPSVMMKLAAELGVDTDHIVRHQVCELYSAGHDKLAEEVSAGRENLVLRSMYRRTHSPELMLKDSGRLT